jgi:virulence-associated protein VagC
MNGRSKAVRLPKEFRFEDEDEVMIKRMDDVEMMISIGWSIGLTKD